MNDTENFMTKSKARNRNARRQLRVQRVVRHSGQDNPPWPAAVAKPGDVWGAYRLESDGWWRLAPPAAQAHLPGPL
jgi:hypothetical protein